MNYGICIARSFMPQQYDKYEEFISSLVKNIKESGRVIRDLGFGRRNKLRGISGQCHQIDVSFIDESFPNPTLVLIECKRCTGNVAPSVPKILKYNAGDITSNPKYPADAKMIITTTSAFSSGARRIAEYEKICIQTVNHGPPFGFSYESLIQVFMADRAKVSDGSNLEIVPKRRK